MPALPDDFSADDVRDLGVAYQLIALALVAGYRSVLHGLAALETVLAQWLGVLLPDREFADPAVRDITVEDLATHRSGLPALAPRDGLGFLVSATASLRGADPYAGVGVDDVLDAVCRITLTEDKGTVRYSNFGMSVLGQDTYPPASVAGPPPGTSRGSSPPPWPVPHPARRQ